jgi:hypothetical protein
LASYLKGFELMTEREPFSSREPPINPIGVRAAPYIPPQALEGVRMRRIIAVMLDLILVSGMSAALFVALFILSAGLSAFILPPLFPIVAFFYNGLHGRRSGAVFAGGGPCRAVLHYLALPAAAARFSVYERQALPARHSGGCDRFAAVVLKFATFPPQIWPWRAPLGRSRLISNRE